MTSLLWNFEPLDTLFIRDGTPFNAGEGGKRGLISLFPPPVTTCQGAIRTALAYGQGWTPKHPDRWPEELGKPDNIGDLELRGPFMRRGGEFLYPAPLIVLEKKECENIIFHRLYPLVRARCDLNPEQDVLLSGLKEGVSGAKLLTEYWFSKKGIEKVLAGGLPDPTDIYKSDELWNKESRVGITLDRKTRTAEKHKLYSTFHIRAKHQVSFSVSVKGVPEQWHHQAPSCIAFGGEGRVACISRESDDKEYLPRMPEFETGTGKICFTITLITPAFFGKKTSEVIQQGPTSWVPGNCVSACLGKLVKVGGWDIDKQEPRPLQGFLPAGSTWFFEAEEKHMEQIKNLHGTCLGEKTEMGHGHVIIGRWEGVK
jgi:CRISPR-associated protein Cmr3